MIVGVLSVAAIPLLAEAAATMIRVTSLSVATSARRQGIARALVEAAEQRAEDLGATIVEVSSGRRRERAAAHRFYPALGFEDTSQASVRYWKALDRARRPSSS